MKNKKIKVLYLITGLNIGGAEMVVRNLVYTLNKEKFEVVVVSVSPIGKVGEVLKKEDIKVLSLDAGFKYNPFLFLKLFRLLKKENPDVLHTHLFHADILGRIVGKLSGVPIIISTIHNTNIGGRVREFLLAVTSYLNNTDIAVSQGVAKRALTSHVSTKTKLYVIYNGIDTNLFVRKDSQDMRKKLGIYGKPVLVSVGSLTFQKGYPYLLEAFAGLKDKYPDSKLIILGEGPERNALEEKSQILGIDQDVRFLGVEENVVDYLNIADIFVLPSLWEGFGLVVTEAMSCRIPVVATHVAGVSEIIDDGVNGFLVSPADTQALAEKIRYVLALSMERRHNIVVAARKTIINKFSLEMMVRKYERLYEIILRNKMKYPQATTIKIPTDAIPLILFQRTGYMRTNHVFSLLTLFGHFRLFYKTSVFLKSLLFPVQIKAAFNKDIEGEFSSIEPFLPSQVKSVLDIGSGVGGIDVLISRHYSHRADIFLIDKTKTNESVYYGYKEKGSFYNSLKISQKLLEINGVNQEKIHLQEATVGNKIQFNNCFDVVISLLSWGFHYPIQTYLDEVYEKMNPGGILIVDIRRGTFGEKAVEKKFSKYRTIVETSKFLKIVAQK